MWLLLNPRLMTNSLHFDIFMSHSHQLAIKQEKKRTLFAPSLTDRHFFCGLNLPTAFLFSTVRGDRRRRAYWSENEVFRNSIQELLLYYWLFLFPNRSQFACFLFHVVAVFFPGWLITAFWSTQWAVSGFFWMKCFFFAALLSDFWDC